MCMAGHVKTPVLFAIKYSFRQNMRHLEVCPVCGSDYSGILQALGCCSPQLSREQGLEWRHLSFTNWDMLCPCPGVLLLFQPHSGSTQGGILLCTVFRLHLFPFLLVFLLQK